MNYEINNLNQMFILSLYHLKTQLLGLSFNVFYILLSHITVLLLSNFPVVLNVLGRTK
jgi:hypothetical protein